MTHENDEKVQQLRRRHHGPLEHKHSREQKEEFPGQEISGEHVGDDCELKGLKGHEHSKKQEREKTKRNKAWKSA